MTSSGKKRAKAKKSEEVSMTLEKFAPKKKAATVVPIMPTKKKSVSRNAPHASSKPSPTQTRNKTEKTALNQSGAGMRLPICGIKM